MSTKRICIDAMGIALFVVLTLCLQVPVFENYYLCLGYIAMAVYCYYFGTVSGTLVGTIGVILYCIIISGLRGMPGWALGNIVIGIICGIFCKIARKQENKVVKYFIMLLAIITSVTIGILGVKSITEVLLYAQPFMVRTANNIYAFIADIVVLIAGFWICITYEKVFKRILVKEK